MSKPIVKGLRYPIAPDAWKGGIQPFATVKGQLPLAVITMDNNYTITCEFIFKEIPSTNPKLPPIKNRGKYKFLPRCTVRQGHWQVSYYVAYSDERGESDYAISPDKLDEFIANCGQYYDDAERIKLPPSSTSGSSRLTGPRFPAAPNAWDGGILHYSVARSMLPLKEVFVPPDDFHMWLAFKFKGKDEVLRIVPHVVGRQNPLVLYYAVFSIRHQQVVLAISPNKLDKFAEGAETYLFAGVNTNPQQEYDIEAARMQYHVMRGEWGKAGRALGRSWKAAGTDLSWWANNFAMPVIGMFAMGASRQGAAAMQRLQQTQENVYQQVVTRSARVLNKPEVFRHSITNSPEEVIFARIEEAGGLKLSTGVHRAQHGTGAYAYGKNGPKLGKYIDIEVPAGVAVESITVQGKQTFYRMVPAKGNVVPGRIVGTNLTKDQIALGRRMVATDPLPAAKVPAAPPGASPGGVIVPVIVAPVTGQQVPETPAAPKGATVGPPAPKPPGK